MEYQGHTYWAAALPAGNYSVIFTERLDTFAALPVLGLRGTGTPARLQVVPSHLDLPGLVFMGGGLAPIQVLHLHVTGAGGRPLAGTLELPGRQPGGLVAIFAPAPPVARSFAYPTTVEPGGTIRDPDGRSVDFQSNLFDTLDGNITIYTWGLGLGTVQPVFRPATSNLDQWAPTDQRLTFILPDVQVTPATIPVAQTSRIQIHVLSQGDLLPDLQASLVPAAGDSLLASSSLQANGPRHWTAELGIAPTGTGQLMVVLRQNGHIQATPASINVLLSAPSVPQLPIVTPSQNATTSMPSHAPNPPPAPGALPPLLLILPLSLSASVPMNITVATQGILPAPGAMRVSVESTLLSPIGDTNTFQYTPPALRHDTQVWAVAQAPGFAPARFLVTIRGVNPK
jgi:hypothetical protein